MLFVLVLPFASFLLLAANVASFPAHPPTRCRISIGLSQSWKVGSGSRWDTRRHVLCPGYFKSLADALGKARTASFNDKITYAAQVQSTLRQLLTESSTHAVELPIIALIAVDVVIAVMRDGPKLWHMTFRTDEEENPAHA